MKTRVMLALLLLLTLLVTACQPQGVPGPQDPLEAVEAMADKPKVIFRICGARLSDLCPCRLFKSGWQAGKKLFVAVNEVIAIAYIETERHANAGFGIGLDPFAHVALILGRTAARVVMKARGDTRFDHA